MALVGNRSVLHKSPSRFLSGTIASGDRSNFNKHGMMRNSFESLSPLASIPSGARQPISWVMAKTNGAIASRFEPSILLDSTNSFGYMGLPADGATSFQIEFSNATGELIVSGSGTSDIIIDFNSPLLLASLSGDGTIGFTITTNTPQIEALADGVGATIISMSGSMTPYATGVLAGLAKLAGEVVVETNYGGAVHISENGVDGIEYPAGTATYPVLTMANADYLATKYGLSEYYIRGAYTLLKSFSNTTFYGVGPRQFCKLNLNNQALDGVLFHDLTIEGQLNTSTVGGLGWQSARAKVEFHGCYLHEITDLQGTLFECSIDGATSIKAGGWVSSARTIIEGDNTVFDMQDTAGTTVSMDIESGWAQFINVVDGLIELNVKGGEVSFDASCVSGEYYLEGVGTLFNDGTLTKKENHFIWDEPTNYHIEAGSTGQQLIDAGAAGNPWSSVIESGLTAEQVMRLILASVAGETVIVDNGGGSATLTFKGQNGEDRIVATMDASERTNIVLDGV